MSPYLRNNPVISIPHLWDIPGQRRDSKLYLAVKCFLHLKNIYFSTIAHTQFKHLQFYRRWRFSKFAELILFSYLRLLRLSNFFLINPHLPSVLFIYDFYIVNYLIILNPIESKFWLFLKFDIFKCYFDSVFLSTYIRHF